MGCTPSKDAAESQVASSPSKAHDCDSHDDIMVVRVQDEEDSDLDQLDQHEPQQKCSILSMRQNNNSRSGSMFSHEIGDANSKSIVNPLSSSANSAPLSLNSQDLSGDSTNGATLSQGTMPMSPTTPNSSSTSPGTPQRKPHVLGAAMLQHPQRSSGSHSSMLQEPGFSTINVLNVSHKSATSSTGSPSLPQAMGMLSTRNESKDWSDVEMSPPPLPNISQQDFLRSNNGGGGLGGSSSIGLSGHRSGAASMIASGFDNCAMSSYSGFGGAMSASHLSEMDETRSQTETFLADLTDTLSFTSRKKRDVLLSFSNNRAPSQPQYAFTSTGGSNHPLPPVMEQEDVPDPEHIHPDMSTNAGGDMDEQEALLDAMDDLDDE